MPRGDRVARGKGQSEGPKAEGAQQAQGVQETEAEGAQQAQGVQETEAEGAQQAQGVEEAKAAPSGRRTSRPRARAPKKAVQEAPAPVAPAPVARPVPRLLEKHRQEVVPALMQEFGYRNPMEVPRLEKVVLNIGLGEALQNPSARERATRDLALISGQQPVTTRARKSISGFKLRQGMAIGLMVTIRGQRMYYFMDKLMNSTLSRIRDFRGVSRNAFDGRGNFSLGIREQVIFPEIDYNQIDRLRGLQISVVTTARTDQESLRLLELLGMPFARAQEAARTA